MMYLIMIWEPHRGAHNNRQQARHECLVDLVDDLHGSGFVRLRHGRLYEYNGVGYWRTVRAGYAARDRRSGCMQSPTDNHCECNDTDTGEVVSVHVGLPGVSSGSDN